MVKKIDFIFQVKFYNATKPFYGKSLYYISLLKVEESSLLYL